MARVVAGDGAAVALAVALAWGAGLGDFSEGSENSRVSESCESFKDLEISIFLDSFKDLLFSEVSERSRVSENSDFAAGAGATGAGAVMVSGKNSISMSPVPR